MRKKILEIIVICVAAHTHQLKHGDFNVIRKKENKEVKTGMR